MLRTSRLILRPWQDSDAESPEEFQKLLQAKASPSWVGVVVFILVCVGIGIALQPLFGPHLAEVLFGSTSLF